MKKIFSIILCAAVVLISGCSGASQESQSSKPKDNISSSENASNKTSTSDTSTSSSTESSKTDSVISTDDATDNFELAGYKVKITGDYGFVILDNEFSEYNGQTLLTVNAEAENVSDELEYCALFCTITAPNETKLTLVDALLGDNGIVCSQIKRGETLKGCFAVPYVGDGEYRFEFSDIFSKSVIYKIDITKSDGQAWNSNISSSTNTTSNTQPPKSDETDYSFDVQKWMLGKPESTIVKSETEQYDKNVELETTYYYDNSKFAIKMVYAMDDTVSPFTVALHIFSYEKAMNDAMSNFMEDMVTEYVIIYQYASGDIIMSSYWYLDKNNSIQHLQQWTSIEQNDDIIDKFNELAGN